MIAVMAEVSSTFRLAVYLRANVFTPPPAAEFTRVTADDLLARSRGIDPLTIGKIHDQFYPEVYRYVRYRLDDEPACEDIASEVFLRLLQTLHKPGRPIQNLRGWLLGMASNLVNDHLRARYARPVSGLEENNLPASGDSPEGLAEHAWQAEQVRRALQHLTLEQQHVLALRFAEERSLEETAQLMSKSVGAIKTLQFRALASLRRFLEKS